MFRMTSLAAGGAGEPAHWGLRCAASIGSFGRRTPILSSTRPSGHPMAEGSVRPRVPGASRGAGLRRGAGHPAAAGGRGAGRGRRRVFSAGPGGIQVWSEPWNGEGGTSGSSVLLGSVEWTANAPTRTYITIHRCRVTGAEGARGVGEADLLRRVLDLAGLSGDSLRRNLAAADP